MRGTRVIRAMNIDFVVEYENGEIVSASTDADILPLMDELSQMHVQHELEECLSEDRDFAA